MAVIPQRVQPVWDSCALAWLKPTEDNTAAARDGLLALRDSGAGPEPELGGVRAAATEELGAGQRAVSARG